MPNAKTKTRTAQLITVSEMIDCAFGNVTMNTVNFKMLQTVVVLLAKQMRLLNRQVALESDIPIPTSNSNIVISEIKITKKKKINLPRTSRSYYSTDFQGSTEMILDKNLISSPINLTTKGNRSEITVRSSETNLPGKNLTEPVKSETTLQNEKYYGLLEKLELQREKILRIIDQRKNSREDGVSTPSPMVSLASTEAKFERIIVVENTQNVRKYKSLPLITEDTFDELVKRVNKLEEIILGGVHVAPEFPENIKLMNELRKGASLTDAMAVLQISARLEAAEKALKGILSHPSQLGASEPTDKKSSYVTRNELDTSLDETRAKIKSKIKILNQKIDLLKEKDAAETNNRGIRLEDELNIKEQFQDLQWKIISNTRQLNIIDTGLTSQMTNLHEQLAQVQSELEAGLITMTENIASKGVDTEEITELNRNFAKLKMDIDRFAAIQKELSGVQKTLTFEIERLKYDVELLRDIKCDRDEVEDALRDKAGLKDLNGMVTEVQFATTFSSVEKSINESYSTLRKYETVWQRALNTVFESLDEKVQLYQLQGLAQDTNNHLNNMKREIDSIKKLLGEPLAATVCKKIYRDTACLSCANPANIRPLNDYVPELPPLRPPGANAGTQALKASENGLPPCLAGIKIIHPTNSRSDICTRYCGGSQTKQRLCMSRKRRSIRLEGKSLLKPDLIDSVGSAEKRHQIEKNEIEEKPCLPCNHEIGSGEGSIAITLTFDQSNLMGSGSNHLDTSLDKNEKCLCGEESPMPNQMPN